MSNSRVPMIRVLFHNAFKRVKCNHFRVLLFGLLGALPVALVAQDDLPAEQVEILKNFEAQLADVQKIQGYPEPPALDTSPVEMLFHPARFNYTLGPVATDIRARKLLPQSYPQETRGFLQLAVGAPKRLDARALYTFGESGTYEATIYALHEEASSSYTDFQQWRHQAIGLEGAHYLNDEWTISVRTEYDRRVNFIYGHPDADTLNAAALRRRIGQFNVGAGAEFNSKGGSDHFEADIDIWGILDSYGTSERQTILKARYERIINNGHRLGADLLIDAGRLKDTLNRRLDNYLLKPYYRYNNSRLSILAGLNIYNHSDRFSFLPDVHFRYALLGSQWQLEAGISGNLEKNGFRQLINYNPFVEARLDSLANSTVRNYYIGIKGITRNIQYSFRGGFRDVVDMSLFQFISEGPAQGFFQVLFDNVSMPYLELYGNIPWTASTSVELYYNVGFLNPEKEEKAWHRPTFESYIKLNLSPIGKRWQTSAQLWVIGGIAYQDEDGMARTLDPIIDLRLLGEYRINRNFDAFLEVRNLPGNRWSRWVNYPVFSTNFLAGIQYRLP